MYILFVFTLKVPYSVLVVKSLYVVSVGLDGHFSRPGIGARKASTDTRSALYVGGHERSLKMVCITFLRP